MFILHDRLLSLHNAPESTSQHTVQMSISFVCNISVFVTSSFLLHVFLFSCLGSQKCNVYTIKENSISTTPNTTNQYTMTKPNKFKEPLLSPFSRSQSFNTYKRYQPNQENDRLYFRTNAQNYGYINASKNTQSVSRNSTDMCIWDDKQSKNGHQIPFSTDCTNNRVSHTNIHTQYPKASLSTTHINYVSSPVKRSDSFSSGKIFMSKWFVKTYFKNTIFLLIA